MVNIQLPVPETQKNINYTKELRSFGGNSDSTASDDTNQTVIQIPLPSDYECLKGKFWPNQYVETRAKSYTDMTEAEINILIEDMVDRNTLE